MPRVSPELDSAVSGSNPSQLRRSLKYALNFSTKCFYSICFKSSLLIPCDSEMLMALLSAVIILVLLCQDLCIYVHSLEDVLLVGYLKEEF